MSSATCASWRRTGASCRSRRCRSTTATRPTSATGSRRTRNSRTAWRGSRRDQARGLHARAVAGAVPRRRDIEDVRSASGVGGARRRRRAGARDPELAAAQLRARWLAPGSARVAHGACFERCAMAGATTTSRSTSCTARRSPAGAHDPAATRIGAYRAALDAVRAGVGPDRFILGCGALMAPSVGVFDGNRIGPDVAPFWRNLTREERAAPKPRARTPDDNLSAEVAIRNTLTRSWMHGRLWANDPDCLLVRTDAHEAHAGGDADAGERHRPERRHDALERRPREGAGGAHRSDLDAAARLCHAARRP